MYEVGVLGVGSMGSMALRQLARRGIKVIGFEQFTVGHDKGAAGGETRIFRTAYRESPEYVPLLQKSLELWRELEAQTGSSLLDLNGVATVGGEKHHHVRSVIRCIEQFGLEAEILDRADANRRYPTINVLEGELVVLDKAGGLVKPERAVTIAASDAEEHGATIMRRAKVIAIEPDDSGVWVRTQLKDIRVNKLILTAGAWAGQFLNTHQPGLITPHRLVLSWFLAKNPALFHPGVFPVVNRLTRGADFSVFPSQDGNTVKAGLNIDIGPIGSADNLPPTVEFSEISRICAIVSEIYPDLWPDPIRSSSYTDGFTRDEHSILGILPEFANVIVAAGFSAHGFKLAPAIGTALADLATTGETSIPVGHLSPRRLEQIGALGP
jgi:sarcosine oxidase